MKKNFLLLLLVITIFSCNSHKHIDIKEIDGDNNVFFWSNSEIIDSSAREFFNEGLEYVQVSNFIIADSLFYLADKIEPDNVIIINAIALNSYHRDTNSENKAFYYNLFERAIELDSTFPYTYSNYAYCLNKNKEYQKAIDFIEKGIDYVEDNKTNGIFNYTLSISYFGLGECKMAEKYIDIAIRLQNDKILLEDYKNFKKDISSKCR